MQTHVRSNTKKTTTKPVIFSYFISYCGHYLSRSLLLKWIVKGGDLEVKCPAANGGSSWMTFTYCPVNVMYRHSPTSLKCDPVLLSQTFNS